jgi:hypothetical protein
MQLTKYNHLYEYMTKIMITWLAKQYDSSVNSPHPSQCEPLFEA